MNKQCVHCEHIMLVPDIPLPAGYTQKCIACGKPNMVADSYDEPVKEPKNDFASHIDSSDVIDFSSGAHQFGDSSFTSDKKDFNFDIPSKQQKQSNHQTEALQSQINHLQNQIVNKNKELKPVL